MAKRYWLMKTEPDVFSFDHLVAAKNMTAPWDGVRNYQARNFMRDEFHEGDGIFIYHSSCDVPGVVGTAIVARTAYADHTALDPKSKFYDEKSARDGQSRWVMVDVKAEARFAKPVTLAAIRKTLGLEKMLLIKRGQRLSIQPVTKGEWDLITKLGGPVAIQK